MRSRYNCSCPDGPGDRCERFFFVILAARLLRYFADVYLGIRLGSGAQPFLARNAWLVAGIVAAAIVAMFVLLRWTTRRPSRP